MGSPAPNEFSETTALANSLTPRKTLSQTSQLSRSQIPDSQYIDEIINVCFKLLSFRVTRFVAIDN